MVNLETMILLLGMPRKGKALRGLWVVPPTVSDRPHVVPPRGAPPGAGVGSAPSPVPQDVNKPTEHMVKALKLLQNVMTKEDFSKYEKLVMPPPPLTRGEGEAS